MRDGRPDVERGLRDQGNLVPVEGEDAEAVEAEERMLLK